MTRTAISEVQAVTQALRNLVAWSEPPSMLAHRALRQWHDTLLPRMIHDHPNPIRDCSDPEWIAFHPKFISEMLNRPRPRLSASAIYYLRAYISVCMAIDSLDQLLSGDTR